jgi:hypothetical protein
MARKDQLEAAKILGLKFVILVEGTVYSAFTDEGEMLEAYEDLDNRYDDGDVEVYTSDDGQLHITNALPEED